MRGRGQAQVSGALADHSKAWAKVVGPPQVGAGSPFSQGQQTFRGTSPGPCSELAAGTGTSSALSCPAQWLFQSLTSALKLLPESPPIGGLLSPSQRRQK